MMFAAGITAYALCSLEIGITNRFAAGMTLGLQGITIHADGDFEAVAFTDRSGHELICTFEGGILQDKMRLL